MPEAELVLVDGMLYVRTYATLSTPEVVMCDYATKISWIDWAWGSESPEPLPVPLTRTRYPGCFEQAPGPGRPNRREFWIDPSAKSVRHEIVPVPCPKVRAGTEVRWEDCRGYWQKWVKSKNRWEAI